MRMDTLEKINFGLTMTIYAVAVMSFVGFFITLKPHCALIGAALVLLARVNQKEA